MICDYCDAPFAPRNRRQAYCSDICCRAMDRMANSYTPIDVVLARPRSKILRAMRWHDWLETSEIVELVGGHTKGAPGRDAHDKALERMRADRLVAARRVPSAYDMGSGSRHTEYRLTKRGIREADRVRFGVKTPRRAA